METMFEWIFRLFLILLAVLWVCLPFALFGTKGKLSEMIHQNEAMLAELRALRASMDALGEPDARTASTRQMNELIQLEREQVELLNRLNFG